MKHWFMVFFPAHTTLSTLFLSLFKGTGDAGANIYNKDKVVYKKMKTLGQKLNLKPHKVNIILPLM